MTNNFGEAAIRASIITKTTITFDRWKKLEIHLT